MDDEQALAWTAIVPAILLMILQQTVLVAVVRTTDEISLSTFTDRLHPCDRGGLDQFLWLIPA